MKAKLPSFIHSFTQILDKAVLNRFGNKFFKDAVSPAEGIFE
jgi:hypothetical protein